MFYSLNFVDSYKIKESWKFDCFIKGELWVKLNFQVQISHNVSYLRSNCE